MVKILISHHHVWQPVKVTADIIHEYQTTGRVVIDLCAEGPCADDIGLYDILDRVCEKFSFDKKNITISTCNFEETHPEYIIKRQPQHWINSTIKAFESLKFDPMQKDPTKNLFACMYNKPSWDRLCILSYIHTNTESSSLLYCNGVWEGACYNSFYLNDLTDFFPEMFFTVADFLKTKPTNAAGDVTQQPTTAEKMLEITYLYNHFFIDVIAETHAQGLSFFITEKTLRPMLAMTPFILQAPKSFLRTLKSDYKIKSFDKWWSEEYDNYDGSTRLKYIFKVIDSIAAWSLDDRKQIYQDMIPILQHNQKIWLAYNKKSRPSNGLFTTNA